MRSSPVLPGSIVRPYGTAAVAPQGARFVQQTPIATGIVLQRYDYGDICGLNTITAFAAANIVAKPQQQQQAKAMPQVSDAERHAAIARGLGEAASALEGYRPGIAAGLAAASEAIAGIASDRAAIVRGLGEAASAIAGCKPAVAAGLLMAAGVEPGVAAGLTDAAAAVADKASTTATTGKLQFAYNQTGGLDLGYGKVVPTPSAALPGKCLVHEHGCIPSCAGRLLVPQ